MGIEKTPPQIIPYFPNEHFPKHGVCTNWFLVDGWLWFCHYATVCKNHELLTTTCCHTVPSSPGLSWTGLDWTGLDFSSWNMFFWTLFLLPSFPLVFSGECETQPDRHENMTSLELEESLECTTSSASGNFSSCHSEEIRKYKAVFIANAAGVISIGAPANLVTLLALPYVRLRWASYN